MEQTIDQPKFQNGEKPSFTDFTITKIIPATMDPESGEEIAEQTTTEEVTTLEGTDAKGNPVKYVLLTDGKIATVKEGRGKDIEKATIEAGTDKSKYLSSMMAACVSIDDKPVSMFDLAKLKMKDYMNIQVAFSELNF